MGYLESQQSFLDVFPYSHLQSEAIQSFFFSFYDQVHFEKSHCFLHQFVTPPPTLQLNGYPYSVKISKSLLNSSDTHQLNSKHPNHSRYRFGAILLYFEPLNFLKVGYCFMDRPLKVCLICVLILYQVSVTFPFVASLRKLEFQQSPVRAQLL